MQLPFKKSLAPVALSVAAVLASSGAIAGDWDGLSQEAKDAYREGQLFATYVTSPALESYDIESDVEGSTVSLSGTVETSFEKALAEAIAKGLDEVSTVENNIKVDSETVVLTLVPANGYAQMVQNASTSMRVNSRLLWNEYTDGMDVKVTTRDGEVVLTGVADTEKAKRRAAEIAMMTLGVTSVDNRLTVASDAMSQSGKTKITDEWIKDKVATSYRFSTGIDVADINLAVDNSTVTLSGTADSELERQRVIQIAQDTRGVDAVSADKLKVRDSAAMAKN